MLARAASGKPRAQPIVQFRNPGGDYMTRFIWRTQIAAVGILLGCMAATSRAADSSDAPATSAEVAAPAAADPNSTTTEADPTSPANSVEPVIAPQGGPAPPPYQPASVVGEPYPGNGPNFHPIADLQQMHPLAPMRQRFVAQHTAPWRFPRYDGEPQYVVGPVNRQVAAYEVVPQSADGSEAGGPIDASGACSTCGVDGCCLDQSCSWFGGADYLLIRPHQTYDSAFQISPNGASGPEVTNVNFNPSFGSGVHLFAGYESSCDEALRFGYTYVYNSTLRSAAVPDGASILSPLGAELFPGDSIDATEHLLRNTWNLEDVRKVDFAWCNCKDCPHWDIHWSWGVRMMQLDESVFDSVSGPDGGEFSQKSTFFGAGPRLGINVRRQLGHSRLSAYVSADAALIIGEQRTTGTNTPSGSDGVQALPDFDVQVGLSWKPTCHLTITSGYLFETFGDAVQLSEVSSLALLAPPQASNLSYDGFFFRTEFAY